MRVIMDNHNYRTPPSLMRLGWDRFLDMLDDIEISLIRFEPANDTIIVSYKKIIEEIHFYDGYIPRPHFKLLRKLYENEEIKAGVQYYVVHSADVKEQFNKPEEEGIFWNSIKDEDRVWFMGIVLGGR